MQHFKFKQLLPSVFLTNMITKSTTKNLYRRRGFTLIETLVSLPILLLAISGALYIAYQNVFYIGDAKSNMTAFYLAQEGMEFVRATRDNNLIAGNNWINGSNLNRCVGQDCYVDVINGTITTCSGSCPAMLKNNGYYQDLSGSATPFTRTVHVTETVSDREANVSVTVSWMEKSISRSVMLQEILFNWE